MLPLKCLFNSWTLANPWRRKSQGKPSSIGILKRQKQGGFLMQFLIKLDRQGQMKCAARSLKAPSLRLFLIFTVKGVPQSTYKLKEGMLKQTLLLQAGIWIHHPTLFVQLHPHCQTQRQRGFSELTLHNTEIKLK